MEWDKQIAQHFKKRDNESQYSGPTVGVVASTDPLTVTFNSGQFVLDKELVLTLRMSSEIFTVGTTLLLIPDGTEQYFYVLDKLKEGP